MAMDVFSITGKIAIDYSEAASSLNKVKESAGKTADSLDDVDDAAEDAGDSVDDVGDSADKADGKFTTWKATLANLASQAITALIDKCTELAKQIVDLGVDTETAFAQLETIAGSENVDDLKNSISELSKETGVASSELAIVAYNAISAGSSAEEAMDMVTAATKLGVAGFTDADSALSVLSTAMNSYGDAAGTAAEISDSLIMVQNLGVTTIGSLASSMGKAIATGSAYSVSLGNLESAYVSVTKAGISTEEATTYLNSMMNELGDSGSDVSAILQEKTGKSFTQLMEDGYSLGDVLGILYDSCDNDSTALMNLWSSAEAGKASNAIINQGLEEFNENLETITGSSGATEKAYSTMADTMSTKMSILKTNLQDLGLQIYDGLEKPLSGAITFVTGTVIPGIQGFMDTVSGADFSSITDGIAALQEKMEPLVSLISEGLSWAYKNVLQPLASWAINAGVPAVLEYVGEVFSFIAEVLTVLQPLASWVWENFLQPLASFMADGFISNMGLVGDILSVVGGLIGAMPGTFDAAWAAINSTFSTAIGIIQTLFSSLTESITVALDTAWNFVSGILNNIITGFQSLWESVSAIFNTMTDGLSVAWETIGNIIQVAILFIVELITAAFELITLPFQFIWENCKETLAAAWEAIQNTISTTLEAIESTINAVWNAIVAFLTPLLQGIQATFSTVWNAISSTVSTVINAIKNTITIVMNAIKTTITTVWNAISSAISTVMNTVKSTISSIWNSIKSTVSTVINAIRSVIESVFNAIKTSIQNVLSSISSTFNTIWSNIRSTVSNAVNNVKSTVSSGLNSTYSTVSSVLTNMNNRFTSIFSSVKSTVNNAFSNVKSTTSSGLNSAYSTVSNVLTNIQNKFTSVFNNAKSIVSNAINTIRGYFNFSWSLPSISLPHFSISGSFSLNPPSVPSFGVSWYKKAMEDGMIMNSPTIFGYNADTNQLMAGGEAGSETVVGTESLMEMISAAVNAENEALIEKIEMLIAYLAEYLPQILEAMGFDVVLDNGVLVGELAPAMDEELGRIAKRKSR